MEKLRNQEELGRGDVKAININRKGWEVEEQHLNPFHGPEPAHHFNKVIPFILPNNSLK
jgi:hypothetical protein